MCGEIARAWGNEVFGGFEPRALVELAADRHDMGMDGELPTLDRRTGLPRDYAALSHAEHLPPQFDGPELLAEIEPYAGLLASLHQQSFYRRTSMVAVLTRDGRIERRALRRTARLQERVRAQVDTSQVERNWRLVRYWDGLSHDLLLGHWPRLRRSVPAAGESTRDVQLDVDGGHFTLDPWPFRTERERFAVTGLLLQERFTDEQSLRAAVDTAPEIELAYELEPA
jgi:Protein of unknown function (DUF3891)